MLQSGQEHNESENATRRIPYDKFWHRIARLSPVPLVESEARSQNDWQKMDFRWS